LSKEKKTPADNNDSTELNESKNQFFSAFSSSSSDSSSDSISRSFGGFGIIPPPPKTLFGSLPKTGPKISDVIQLNYYTSESDWDDYFESTHKYWGVRAKNNKRYPHESHGKSACTRLFAEHYMHQHILRLLPDAQALIIGNPNREDRMQKYKRVPGHTLLPPAIDSQRVTENIHKVFQARMKGLDVCEHLPWECTCGIFDVVIATDAMYTMDPLSWFTTISRTRMQMGMAFFHVGQQQEAVVSSEGNQTTVHVEGNGFTCTHWNMDYWLSTNCCRYDDSVLSWTLVKEQGSAKVFQFLITPLDNYVELPPLIPDDYPEVEVDTETFNKVIEEATTNKLWKPLNSKHIMSKMSDADKRIYSKNGLKATAAEVAQTTVDSLVLAKELERREVKRMLAACPELPGLYYWLLSLLAWLLTVLFSSTKLQERLDGIRLRRNYNYTADIVNDTLNYQDPKDRGILASVKKADTRISNRYRYWTVLFCLIVVFLAICLAPLLNPILVGATSKNNPITNPHNKEFSSTESSLTPNPPATPPIVSLMSTAESSLDSYRNAKYLRAFASELKNRPPDRLELPQCQGENDLFGSLCMNL
jgi:hypothetical protein